MECGICSRGFNSKRKPHCVSCTQATLYAPRILQASALLDREKQHTHTEAIVRPGNDGIIAALPQDADLDAIGDAVKKQHVRKAQEERQAIEARLTNITEKADELRRHIKETKQWLADQKEDYAARRSDIAAERKQLERQKPRVLDPVLTASRKAEQRQEKVHNRIVNARTVLCHEAAVLAGLERRTVGGKSEYWLAGARIPDLREVNSKTLAAFQAAESDEMPVQSYEVLSAGFDNVCRLLVSCCHYLGVRLPAEILLPRDIYVHTMIMPDKSSYRAKDPRLPAAPIRQSASPAGSRLQAERKEASSPRPLYLDRPLSQLYKEDTKAFQMFIEGVMLLAYDVAWLCKSQGRESVNSFEDICAIGRNLYQLLVSQEPTRPVLHRNISTATTQKERARMSAPTATMRLGAYSHASAHHSLSSAQGDEYFRVWRLPSPARLADRLKGYLVNEISGAEWDFVTDKEWDEEREDEVPVLVGGARRSLDPNGAAMSVISVRPSDGEPEEPQRERRGWTVVRGRGGHG